MREEEKISKGILYNPTCPELVALKKKAHRLSQDFNKLYEDETEKRAAIIQELFSEIGENWAIFSPLRIHYGKHTRIGRNFFSNVNLVIQDDASVTIGDHCDFGPNTTIVTSLHPMLQNERIAIADCNGKPTRFCHAKPVTIGSRCWFGSNVTVCPGVTIGNGCVIGAGSVVIHDIPDNCFAAGNPCRVIRELSEKDSLANRPHILADNTIIPEGNQTQG